MKISDSTKIFSRVLVLMLQLFTIFHNKTHIYDWILLDIFFEFTKIDRTEAFVHKSMIPIASFISIAN